MLNSDSNAECYSHFREGAEWEGNGGVKILQKMRELIVAETEKNDSNLSINSILS